MFYGYNSVFRGIYLHQRGSEVLRVKKFGALFSAGILCVGFGILLAAFLPASVLMCIEAILLILAGLLLMKY